MFDIDRWEEIWQTIMRNRWRSFMTAMGVFWGIFMLIVMSGSGLGLERKLMGQVGDFATNSCFFFTDLTGEPYKGFARGRNWSFEYSDLDAVKKNIDKVKYATGSIFGSNTNMSYGDRKGSYYMMGLMPEYNNIEPLNMIYGRYINGIDMETKRKVCMLGNQVYKELFPEGGDPVGKLIRVGDSYYNVIGVHVPSSDGISIGANARQSVFIPFTTMQQMYSMGDKFHMMSVVFADDGDAAVLDQEIRAVVKSRHNISPTDTKAVGGFNLKEQFDVFANLFLGIRLLTWIVGVGTLFAGIIGVSNIMLIVVKERTSEIGVRRALGAKPLAIISQIMSESFVLTFVAGVAGLGASVGLLSLADNIINASAEAGEIVFAPQITFSVAITASLLIISGGFMAGIIPAIRALNIKAVDAIREE